MGGVPADADSVSVDLEQHLRKVRAHLKAGGGQARRSLGQHFLLEAGILRRIVRAAGELQGETVVEIGAGPGGLTAALLEAGAEVHAFELDAEWCGFLAGQLGGTPGLHLHPGDVRGERWGDLRDLLEQTPGGVSVVSNLPYQIASPLLVDLVQETVPPRRLVVMVQKEVADRMVARPGTTDRGLLTLLVELRAEVRRLFLVPRGAFLPPPKVISAVVEIRLASGPEPVPPGLLELARRAFQGRRKMLRASLREHLAEQGLGPVPAPHDRRRPQDLSCEDWRALWAAVRGS